MTVLNGMGPKGKIAEPVSLIRMYTHVHSSDFYVVPVSLIRMYTHIHSSDFYVVPVSLIYTHTTVHVRPSSDLHVDLFASEGIQLSFTMYNYPLNEYGYTQKDIIKELYVIK